MLSFLTGTRSVTKRQHLSSIRSSLIHLPNELFPFIFVYFHPFELIDTFGHLDTRLDCLIQQSITQLDYIRHSGISAIGKKNESFFQFVTKLKLTYPQLQNLSKPLTDLFPKLQSVLLTQIMLDDGVQEKKFLTKYVDSLKIILESFSMEFDDMITHEFTQHLFDEQSRLKQMVLTFTRQGCMINTVPIDNDYGLLPCPSLTHLTIDLTFDFEIFILCEYLPCIEYLNIRLQHGHHLTHEYDYNTIKQKQLSRVLKHLRIKLRDYHLVPFRVLLLLIEQYVHSLQYLSLNTCLDSPVDGHQLNLLMKLKSVHFCFRFSVPETFDYAQLMSTFNISTVMCFPNQNGDCVLLTLPYEFDELPDISNRMLQYCLPPNADPMTMIKMPAVTRISFTCDNDDSLKLELFLFVQNACINLKELTISPYQLSTQIIADRQVQLIKVTKMNILSKTIEYSSLKRLLLLVPNIKELYIETLLPTSVYYEELLNDQELALVRKMLNTVKTVFACGNNADDDEEEAKVIEKLNEQLKMTFPNAQCTTTSDSGFEVDNEEY
ncbi:unnamed protein product [Didymodactylos carnosus]|uniref:Uncharacterized protein n=1 Tax=Didymodactylos carnosus TaxID=1234261 RepID=A0A8S2FPT4_9BILA|nr:unnamed protein product [Didymodactylos carnosus]CAF4319440.1 unnamed protein product [Didymodactylos carnosus]